MPDPPKKETVEPDPPVVVVDPPKKTKEPEKIEPSKESEPEDELLKEYSEELSEQIKEKFGKMDLSHLDLKTRIKTMRTMLKAKKSESKEKPLVAGSIDEGPAGEWEPPKSLLAKEEATHKLRDFYNGKKAFGSKTWKDIYGE